MTNITEKSVQIPIYQEELGKPDVKAQGQNRHIITLERKSNLKKSLVFVFLFLSLETCKQMVNYLLTIDSGGKYPVPSTFIMTMTETFKLIVVFIWTIVFGARVEAWKFSFNFSLPAAIYCVTNLLYLHALTLVSPPIWMVMIQTRTLYTAIAYKVIFGRELTLMQCAGCLLVVCSICVTRLSSLNGGQSSVTLSIFMMSQISALLSSSASISIELLLKNNDRSFFEQQWWLYTCGSMFSAVFMMLKEDLDVMVTQLQVVFETSYLLCELALAVVATALAGLCVPVIVRNLDTIVKDYLSALNNIVLAIVTAVLFPNHFSLSFLYILALSILVVGIWLYEKKKW